MKSYLRFKDKNCHTVHQVLYEKKSRVLISYCTMSTWRTQKRTDSKTAVQVAQHMRKCTRSTPRVNVLCINTIKKYEHLTVKESEVDPWEKLCVNFIRSLYLWPMLSNRHDTIKRGSEFMGEFARMVQKDYVTTGKAVIG